MIILAGTSLLILWRLLSIWFVAESRFVDASPESIAVNFAGELASVVVYAFFNYSFALCAQQTEIAKTSWRAFVLSLPLLAVSPVTLVLVMTGVLSNESWTILNDVAGLVLTIILGVLLSANARLLTKTVGRFVPFVLLVVVALFGLAVAVLRILPGDQIPAAVAQLVDEYLAIEFYIRPVIDLVFGVVAGYAMASASNRSALAAV